MTTYADLVKLSDRLPKTKSRITKAVGKASADKGAAAPKSKKVANTAAACDDILARAGGTEGKITTKKRAAASSDRGARIEPARGRDLNDELDPRDAQQLAEALKRDLAKGKLPANVQELLVATQLANQPAIDAAAAAAFSADLPASAGGIAARGAAGAGAARSLKHPEGAAPAPPGDKTEADAGAAAPTREEATTANNRAIFKFSTQLNAVPGKVAAALPSVDKLQAALGRVEHMLKYRQGITANLRGERVELGRQIQAAEKIDVPQIEACFSELASELQSLLDEAQPDEDISTQARAIVQESDIFEHAATLESLGLELPAFPELAKVPAADASADADAASTSSSEDDDEYQPPAPPGSMYGGPGGASKS